MEKSKPRLEVATVPWTPAPRRRDSALHLGKALRCTLSSWPTLGAVSLTRNTWASKAWIESDTYENKSAAEIRLSSLS